MNWLVKISESRENHSYTFSAPNLEAAQKKSLECFDDFCFMAAREYDEEYLPDVDLYEVSKCININVLEHVKEKRKEQQERDRNAQEERDRQHFEFLKKKFDIITIPLHGHNEDDPNCNCRSCGRS